MISQPLVPMLVEDSGHYSPPLHLLKSSLDSGIHTINKPCLCALIDERALTPMGVTKYQAGIA